MDFLDFFENMGLGLTIVIVIFAFLFLMIFLARVIPAILFSFGSLFPLFIVIILIASVIYFIGKFSKGFIKK